ncbi:MAG: L,D-transpeptidase family protein [Thermoanaerobaculia bacterium]|nr:L,D-transpeptidase family protein [Thermoanaerobaculia bacterium]
MKPPIVGGFPILAAHREPGERRSGLFAMTRCSLRSSPLATWLLVVWLPATAFASTTDRSLRIEIKKADRELLLLSGDEVLERFRIGLGFEPVADKTREGDGATPEGEYSVCVKNPQSRYYLSIGLTYPNSDDADRALLDGRIDESVHRRIVESLARGVCPPWDTPLGGEIYVHGRGSGSDWTLGCVALDDGDMKRLYEAVGIGTPVTIKP